MVKYADNILKGFSTSVSIVFCAAYAFLGEGGGANPGAGFVLGTALVVVSSFLYNNSSSVATEEKERSALLPK